MTTFLIPLRETQVTTRILKPGVVVAALAMVACVSGPPTPTAQLAVSAATIDQAVSAGANELAPAELSAARDKLERARAAAQERNNVQALMLAEQAQADAQLAVTRAHASKAEKAAASVQEDQRILREEINKRNQR